MTEAGALNEEEAGAVATERPQVSRMLQEARESRSLSQKQVAEQLFLTTTFIRYIDDGDFHKIPKAAFIKGYLRSYARAVGLSGDEVVSVYESEQSVTPQSPQIGTLTDEQVGPSSFTGPIFKTGVFGLIAVLVVGGLVWWGASSSDEKLVSSRAVPEVLPDEESQPPQDPVPGGEQVSGSPGVAEAGEPEDRRQETGIAETGIRETGIQEASVLQSSTRVPDSALPAPANPVSDAGESALAPARAIREGVEIDRVRDGETQYITVYAGGDEVMEFVFSDECWVQIEDAESELVYRDLNRAGDVMTVYGIAPFEVLLGKAPAVTMIWRGEQVDLSQLTTRDQTATVRTARL